MDCAMGQKTGAPHPGVPHTGPPWVQWNALLTTWNPNLGHRHITHPVWLPPDCPSGPVLQLFLGPEKQLGQEHRGW